MSFRQFRKIEPGEFFLVFGDTSAGGNDYNACQFLSKTKIDVPLVYHETGIATNMTNAIFPVIEKLFDITGIRPTVAYEVNNGGIFELERLATLNRLNKYDMYIQKSFGHVINDLTYKYGWSTNSATRPKMLADLKDAIDNKVLGIYDKLTVNEFFSFIKNKQGKPVAESNAHDDLVMSLAGAWQLYQTEEKQLLKKSGGVPYDATNRPWGYYGGRDTYS